jgi:hypothetical protein
MRCPVCDQDYGLTHACTGIPPAVAPEDVAPPPALRFAPIHYFLEALKILRWDDAAVRRASRDNNALVYGVMILAIGVALPMLVAVVRVVSVGVSLNWARLAFGYVVLLMVSILWILFQIGLSHLLARWLFQAKGSYLALLRAFFLGQMYQWLSVIPYVGGSLAGLGGIAVLMMVFEEVDEIERMKAFGLATAVGVTFFILGVYLQPAK